MMNSYCTDPKVSSAMEAAHWMLWKQDDLSMKHYKNATASDYTISSAIGNCIISIIYDCKRIIYGIVGYFFYTASSFLEGLHLDWQLD